MEHITKYLFLAMLVLSNCTIGKVSYKKRADLPNADICALGDRRAPLNYNVFTSNENNIHVQMKISWERHSIWLLVALPLFGLVQENVTNSVEIKVTNERKKPIFFHAFNIQFFEDISNSIPLENSRSLNNGDEVLPVRIMPNSTLEIEFSPDKSMMGKARLAKIRFTEADTGVQLYQIIHIQETSTICTWPINR